ncbi:MAG: ParB/RepB/Spo0J family partition protein [Spirochaetota bacterium]|nr:ParB/RepB/Spo0J family partition protein [Spirochaetota bacterium]
MSMKKKGLGKGLAALVEEHIVSPLVEIKPLENEYAPKNNGVLTVSPNDVLPSRYQPRKEFDEAFLEELADSIRKHGIIQPLVVSDLGDGTYELVAGERRLRASKLAGMKTVPIVIREFEDKDRLAVALIENIQRTDLNAIEVAEAYQEMIDRVNLTQEEVSLVVGKSRTSVANTLRLLKLPDSIRTRVINNNISEGHGRAILSLYPNFQKMEEVARISEEEDLSVRQTEDLTRKILSDDINKNNIQKSNSVSYNHRIQSLEEKLVKILGVKTKISGNIDRGSIKFFYHTPEELEILIQNILKNRDS